MNHKGTLRIDTENLILRKFKLSDAEAMYKNWASDSEVTKFLTWNPIDSVEVSKSIIEGWVDEYKNNNIYQWAIVSKNNGDEPIGAISVVQK